MRKLLFVLLSTFQFFGLLAQPEYFETIISVPPAGEHVREGAYAVEANKDFIRLRTRLLAEVNGPNTNASGYLDYNLNDSSIGKRLYWSGGYNTDPIDQIFPQTHDSTLVIQSTDLDGRLRKYEWQYIYYLNHTEGTFDFWNIERRIAAINVQKHQGDFYGLYSHKLFRGDWLQEDTIVLARINFEKEELDIIDQYILPFEPDNAGFFKFRPEDGQFDFVFENFRVTYNLGTEIPISVDSTYYLHSDTNSAGSRALNLMYGWSKAYLRDSQNLRVTFADSAGDSVVYSFDLPKVEAGLKAQPTAIRMDADSNLLVLFGISDNNFQKYTGRMLHRLKPNGEVIQKLPIQLKNKEVRIDGIYEDAQGNFILTGGAENKLDHSIDSEIFLARVSPKGYASDLQLPETSDFALAPNPATDYIKIIGPEAAKEFQYQIVNTKGQVVIEGSSYVYLQIDISSLSPGGYVIEVEIDNQPSQSLRFIKE